MNQRPCDLIVAMDRKPRGFWDSLPRPFAALAPMEDVTDTVFRRLVGMAARPHLFFTEFVSTDGLCSAGHDAVAHRLDYTEAERPIVAQIWGTVPEHFLRSARMIAELGFDGIDINMGCPVKKIVKNGACSALIDNPTLAAELYHATVEGAGQLPVSIKTRMGFKRRKTEEWSRFLLELEPVALTMHGRVAKDMSEVPADWDEVARVVSIRDQLGVSTLVIGNGDVVEASQLTSFPVRYGVDGVMVARGIFHDLFIFRGITPAGPDRLHPFETLPRKEKIDWYRRHISLYRATWGDEKNFNIMKKFAKPYIAGFAGAAKLRNELMESQNYREMLEILAVWGADSEDEQDRLPTDPAQPCR